MIPAASNGSPEQWAPLNRKRGERHHASTLLWRRVDKSGGPEACWPWTGGTVGGMGHGRLRVENKAILAHRLAWQLTNGPIPDGLCVCHRTCFLGRALKTTRI